MSESETRVNALSEELKEVNRVLGELKSKGDIDGAAAASQEIQVEVCNALSSREKAEFLLEQVLTPFRSDH